MIVIGDSILRGTEGPICCQDALTHKVYCLPTAKIQDLTGMIQAVIQPTDYYPTVLIHVAKRSPDHPMADYHALAGRAEGDRHTGGFLFSPTSERT